MLRPRLQKRAADADAAIWQNKIQQGIGILISTSSPRSVNDAATREVVVVFVDALHELVLYLFSWCGD
jgi:hypothetical protein